MPVLDQVEEGEGPEHRELAMREVDDAHDAEQQREAERDQDIDRAQADAVDEHLAQDCRIEHRTSFSRACARGRAQATSSVYGMNFALVTSLPPFTSAK